MKGQPSDIETRTVGDDLSLVFHYVGPVEQRIGIVEERTDLIHGVIEVFVLIIDGADVCIEHESGKANEIGRANRSDLEADVERGNGDRVR